MRSQLLLLAITLWLHHATCSQQARAGGAESRQCPSAEEAVAPPQTAHLLQQLRELVTAAEAADAALQTGLQQARHLLSNSEPDIGLAGELAVLQQSHAVREQAEFSFSGGTAVQPYNANHPRTASRKLPAWPEYFSFLAAVRTDARVLSGTVVRRAPQSAPRFIALGDQSGRLYLFTPAGDIAAEYTVGHPVTALTSHQPSSNLTMLVAGLQNGQVRLLKVHQRISRIAPRAPEVVHVEGIAVSATLGGTAAVSEDTGSRSDVVTHLEILPAGRHGFQYIAAHANGTVAVWRADGTLRQSAHLGHPLLHLSLVPTRFGSQILLLHRRGAASWRLSSPKDPAPQPVMRACKGLNDTLLAAAAYQPLRGAFGRYFALSEDGRLLTFASSEMLTNCKVINAVEAVLPISLPAVLAALPGYLLVGTGDLAAVYNTTGPVSRTGPRGVVAASLQTVALAAGLMGDRPDDPLLLTADPKLLAMSIGDDLVAMFHVTVGRPEAAVAASMLAWARPVIIIVVALVGVWHFRMRGQGVPFNTRRPPDLALEKPGRNRRRQPRQHPAEFLRQPPDYQTAGQGPDRGPLGMPHGQFGGPDAIRDMVAELDAAAMGTRRVDEYPSVEDMNRQVLAEIDSVLQAKGTAAVSRGDQDVRQRWKQSAASVEEMHVDDSD